MNDNERKILEAELYKLSPQAQEILRKSLAIVEIEIIDEKHQRFNGQIFYNTKKGHLYRTVTLHEAVWRFHFGDIPVGYVIHHRNGDKTDNRIENLQLMTNSEHRVWHNQHDKIAYHCDYCGKEIRKCVTGRSGKLHFCDGHCWGRYIIENKVYHQEQICVICGKKFLAHKYSKTKTCSTGCKCKLISQTKREKLQH